MNFDPFFRHRGTAEPIATAVEPVKEKPPAKPARSGRAFDPFAGYQSKKQCKLIRKEEPPAQKLLNFLQHDWPHEIIRLRDLTNYGPGPLRDRKKLIELAAVLVGHGWLTPIKSSCVRRDTKWWRIIRGPSGYPTKIDVALNVAPNVANVALDVAKAKAREPRGDLMWTPVPGHVHAGGRVKAQSRHHSSPTSHKRKRRLEPRAKTNSSSGFG
jgi:hypothetical protein